MKRVFYTSYQPYALVYAKILFEEFGWNPVYWYVSDETEIKIKEKYPNVITHNYYDAIKSILPHPFKEEELELIDSVLLTELASYESIILNMMNRNYLFDLFSYQERIRHYHRLLQFYLTLIKKLNPDIIVFEETPHQPCDYILYVLAQKMGVKTILFESSFLMNYILPMSKFEEGNIQLQNSYKNASIDINNIQFELSEYTQNEINKIKGTFDKGMQFYMLKHVEDFKKKAKPNMIKKIFKGIILLVKLFNIIKFKKRINFLLNLKNPTLFNIYKKKNFPIEKSVLSNLDYQIALRKINKIKTDNLKYYQKIQNNRPDLNLPFIFCALHFQPEKSTSPWGGQFVNQILMIEMLSRCIPVGWKIYVKDHIAQYTMAETGEPARSKLFYDDIVKLKNVEIIPMELISFDLIDKAQAVASIAGSVLWEAVVKEKPALAFGSGHHCWCGGCEGIFYTPDIQSLKIALKKIERGYKIDYNKFLLYAHLIEKIGYRGYAGGTAQAKQSGISVEENGRIHAKAIKDFFYLNSENQN